MTLKLKTVIQIGYNNQDLPTPDKYPYWEYPELWDKYNSDSYKKAGFKDELKPYLEGLSFYRLSEITDIKINEFEIDHFNLKNEHIESIVFKNGDTEAVTALFARPPFEQHCNIPQQLNCEMTGQHYIKVDAFQKTTAHGIFASGDNTTMMRSVSYAVATSGIAGAIANRELIEESF